MSRIFCPGATASSWISASAWKNRSETLGNYCSSNGLWWSIIVRECFSAADSHCLGTEITMKGDTERSLRKIKCSLVHVTFVACVCVCMCMFLFFTFPYSKSYATETVVPGSLPFFLTRTKPTPSRWASRGPNRKPRASKPAHIRYTKPPSEVIKY